MTDIKIICAPNPNPNCVKVMLVSKMKCYMNFFLICYRVGWVPTALDIKC